MSGKENQITAEQKKVDRICKAANGDLESLQKLVNEIPQEERRNILNSYSSHNLYTPLIIACRVSLECTRFLLQMGADTEIGANCGGHWKPLHFAAYEESRFDCFVELLNYGADSKAMSNSSTVESIAQTKRNKKALKYLKEYDSGGLLVKPAKR